MESPITLTYSRVGPLDIKLDVHIPRDIPPGKYPGIVFFHGGGIVAGNREALRLQQWLIAACSKNHTLLISADYRLLHPSTGFNIIQDVQELFKFIFAPGFATHLPESVTLDTSRLVASGESGGGYPALASALYSEPRPKGLLMQYTMSGQMLSDHYLRPKSAGEKSPYLDFGGDGSLDDVLKSTKEVSDDPTPFMSFQKGSPSARGRLLHLWWREATFVDHLLGRPGVSAVLRQGDTVEARERAVPEDLRDGLLQLGVQKLGEQGQAGRFPETMIVHGEDDTMVLPTESEHLHRKIVGIGGKSDLLLVPRAGHGLVDEDDFRKHSEHLEPGAEAQKALTRVEEWLVSILSSGE